MMTSSNGNIFRVTGPSSGNSSIPGEFPAQRPVTRNFDVFFDLRPNKRLNKPWWGWWFETLLWSFWRHCNALISFISSAASCLLLLITISIMDQKMSEAFYSLICIICIIFWNLSVSSIWIAQYVSLHTTRYYKGTVSVWTLQIIHRYSEMVAMWLSIFWF